MKEEHIFGIVADPAKHSLSPKMHTAACKKLGLNAVCKPFDVSSSELEEFMGMVKSGPIKLEGFSVSMPHKEAIIDYLDEITDEAKQMNAVSCVYKKEDRLIGTNLDYIGVKGSIESADVFINDLSKKESVSALIIGAGGAARAAVFGLKKLGEQYNVHIEITLTNRTFKKAEAIASQFNVNAVNMDELSNVNAPFDMLINTTSVGLTKDFELLDQSFFDNAKLSLDAIYKKDPITGTSMSTVFQAQSQKAGIESLTGLDWLLNQGFVAFELWTGQNAPKEVMENAVR